MAATAITYWSPATTIWSKLTRWGGVCLTPAAASGPTNRISARTQRAAGRLIRRRVRYWAGCRHPQGGARAPRPASCLNRPIRTSTMSQQWKVYRRPSPTRLIHTGPASCAACAPTPRTSSARITEASTTAPTMAAIPCVTWTAYRCASKPCKARANPPRPERCSPSSPCCRTSSGKATKKLRSCMTKKSKWCPLLKPSAASPKSRY